MRARIVVVFLLGFAAGVLCLGVALWRWGGFTASASAQKAPPSLPLNLNGLLAQARDVPLPAPAAVPPADYAQPAPSPHGEADRMSLEVPSLHLSMPLAGIDPATLTGTFQETRDGHKHEALDIMAPRGTPVLAAADGNVAKLFTGKQGGLTVYQFDNSRTWCLYYAHLNQYAPGLREGTLLHKGEVLGYVGSTGDASPDAPHLHFAVFRLGPDKKWWEGTAIDALPLLQ